MGWGGELCLICKIPPPPTYIQFPTCLAGSLKLLEAYINLSWICHLNSNVQVMMSVPEDWTFFFISSPFHLFTSIKTFLHLWCLAEFDSCCIIKRAADLTVPWFQFSELLLWFEIGRCFAVWKHFPKNVKNHGWGYGVRLGLANYSGISMRKDFKSRFRS